MMGEISEPQITPEGQQTASVKPNWTRAFFVGKSPAGGLRRPLVPAPSELREVVDRGVTFRVVWDGSIR